VGDAVVPGVTQDQARTPAQGVVVVDGESQAKDVEHDLGWDRHTGGSVEREPSVSRSAPSRVRRRGLAATPPPQRDCVEADPGLQDIRFLASSRTSNQRTTRHCCRGRAGRERHDFEADDDEYCPLSVLRERRMRRRL
jgi:hypothetical protein